MTARAAQRSGDPRRRRARIRHPGDGSSDHEQIGSGRERLLRRGDPRLIHRGDPLRPYARSDEGYVRPDLRADRSGLLRRADDRLGTRIHRKRRKASYGV